MRCCVFQCAAIRAHYMKKHPAVYADAINRYNRAHHPMGGQRVTAADVLALASREEQRWRAAAPKPINP